MSPSRVYLSRFLSPLRSLSLSLSPFARTSFSILLPRTAPRQDAPFLIAVEGDERERRPATCSSRCRGIRVIEGGEGHGGFGGMVALTLTG